MQISKINISTYRSYYSRFVAQKQILNNAAPGAVLSLAQPFHNNYNFNINFKAFSDPNRTVADMEFENYRNSTESTKKRYRKLYDKFTMTKYIDKSKLFDPQNPTMPLRSEKNMDEFIKISGYYKAFKENPIICLGRSPKWFLNTALWMKDGIPDYKFAAFSKSWYEPNWLYHFIRVNSEAPTEKEIESYRKYLKRIKADPETIVKTMKETGKQTIITDYICTGKGACSFLEILGNYANDLGILEDFTKAITIVGIGSLEYMEHLHPENDEIRIPRVPMPHVLQRYTRNIEQKFYDMEYTMFREMLLNKNTNECRSTYYPHEAWCVYKPDKFKTGLVTDMKKIKKLLKELKDEKYIISFSAAMGDFRNLLNFRILDALNSRNLLKAAHKTKI